MPAKLIAYLAVANAHEAIDFYERAFGAVEQSRIEENGRIGHAELHIGDDAFYLSDEWPEMKVLGPDKLPGTAVSLVLEVPDVDAAFERAINAGATVERPITDQEYGRTGWLVDPFGHRWSLYSPPSA